MTIATALSLVGVIAVLTMTVAIGSRSRSRRHRGLMLRWGLPRAPRRSFASWGEVRSRLGARVARTTPIIVEPTGPDAVGKR